MKTKKHLVFTMFLALCLFACKEEFHFEDQTQSSTSIEDAANDYPYEGTYITTGSDIFRPGQTINGYDSCTPMLEARSNGDRSSVNADCASDPGGWVMFLYKNGTRIGHYVEGATFSADYGIQGRMDWEWTIPNDLPDGTGYQIGMGYFFCSRAGSPIYRELGCRLSREFEVKSPPDCEIAEAGRPISATYRTGQTMYFNFNLFSNSNTRTVQYQILRFGTVVWQDTRDLGNISVDDWLLDRYNITLNGIQFPVGSGYELVANLDCGNGLTSPTYRRSFRIIH